MAAATVDVRGPLPAEVGAAVRGLVDAETSATGVRPLSDDAMLALDAAADDGAGENYLLVLDADGRLIAYGWLPPRRDGRTAGATVDLEVALGPSAGDGTASALTAIVDRAVDVLGRQDRDPGTLRVWSRGQDSVLAAMLRRLGAQPDRELLSMRRGITDALPEPQWPAGVAVRTFRVGQDESGWLALNNRAFAGHPDQSGWGQAEIRSRESRPWFDPGGFFLAGQDDGLLGFHWTKVHPATRRDPDGLGEVYIIGVDPDAQGRHLGGALLLVGLRHLQSRGLADVLLYVDGDNTAARAMYDRWGFAIDDRDVRFQPPRA